MDQISLNSESLACKQNTIKKQVSFSGVGIHTGSEVSMSFCPAKANTGIIFQRVDLPAQPVIPATIEYVQDTSGRNTTIGLGDARVHTIEHVMAALYTFGIDNVVVKVNAHEPPVGNGSSDVFIRMLEEAQKEEQEATKQVMVVREPVYLSEGNIQLIALPCDDYKISYTLHYPKIKSIGTQYHSMVVNYENFKNQVSECRTFALFNELKMLMDAGLIKGGSLDNAVVIHDEAVFSKEGLKFPNEMVRHKMLDVIGDLALVGFSFKAHIISICSGHATNVLFAKKLLTHLTMETV